MTYSPQQKPMKAGLGIRPELFEPVLSQRPDLGFLEAHSENYFQPSVARAKLMELREHYPISLHGVGLSLGRADDLDSAHLTELKKLADEVEPLFVSEHLAWSAYSHRHLPDLLPLPLTKQAFEVICTHIKQMQDALQRQVLLENPSNYLVFDQLQIPEPDFLNAVGDETGCGLLLDINNIHVSASNLQQDGTEYLHAINGSHVHQYHLAGYLEMQVAGEPVLIDTHNQTVYPEVWQLYRMALETKGDKPTLFEWDSDFPEFSILLNEVKKADELQSSVVQREPSSQVATSRPNWSVGAQINSENGLDTLQSQFLDSVLTQTPRLSNAIDPHAARIWIYQNNTFGATLDYLSEVFPATQGVVGEQFFRQMSARHVQINPPSQGNIYYFGDRFAEVIGEFDGLANMPYLADLIRLEWAIHSAYFADVSNVLNPADYSQEALLEQRVHFNPSVWFYQSAYPVWEIYRQSLPNYVNEVSIDLSQSQDALLVFKQGFAVETRVLHTDEALFFKNLQKSENLLQAIEQLSGSLPPETLSAAVATAFEYQLLSAADTTEQTQ